MLNFNQFSLFSIFLKVSIIIMMVFGWMIATVDGQTPVCPSDLSCGNVTVNMDALDPCGVGTPSFFEYNISNSDCEITNPYNPSKQLK